MELIMPTQHIEATLRLPGEGGQRIQAKESKSNIALQSTYVEVFGQVLTLLLSSVHDQGFAA